MRQLAMVDKQESEKEKDKAEKLNAETRLGRRQQPPPFILYETRGNRKGKGRSVGRPSTMDLPFDQRGTVLCVL
ncbi:hypothetical protein T02_10213 [Trichinella nativa]|uniref:Uncharacterized protein n=1 Tax=Trichinella nativa TaxID=6335 RepID=A0A0V1L2J5_9BILA|nr:hypothetical protein T02_10213 [Trichinella nativa]